VQGMAESFVETELGRLETELKSLHAQQPRLSASDEVHLLSILKAALGDDKDVFSDLVAPTLDVVAASSKLENKLDRYTSGLLLQLKMKFVILVKEAIISRNTQAAATAPEGPETEDIIIEGPTVAPAAASSEDGAAPEEPPVYVDIAELMPSATEQQLHQVAFVKSCHKNAKEQTESEFNLVLERSNVATEKKVEFLERFRSLLERRLNKLLKKDDEQSKPPQEGATTRKRAHRLNREEREEELTNSLMKKLLIAEGRMDGKIKREMDRLLRKYEDLMKKYLAGCSEVPIISSSSAGSSSRMPPRPPPPVDPIPPPPPTVSIIAIHLGWNHTHVGWIPPKKTSVELLLPPIPCLIGLRKEDSVVLYGDQNYEALRETFTSLWESDDEEDGTGTVPSTWHNLKSILADKEVEWRKGKGKVKSELLLALFLIHVKKKIEAALPPHPSNYKVMLVLPQVLSIVQRGRIFDATNLAGFEVDEVRFVKETTAAALAFAHDADIWSPGSVLPIVVCCPQDILRSTADDSNADVGIFSNEDGIVSMEGSAGGQGLGHIGVLEEMTKIKEMTVPFQSKLNKNSIFVHLDDGNYEEMLPCTQKEEMQEFRARSLQLHGRINRWSASGDLLDKIREHLTHSTVRSFAMLSILPSNESYLS
jgi:hypothetical protein